jgi:hypothetical protein
VWLAAVEAPAALARRGRAARALGGDASPADRAELAWIDGLLAVARRDAAALAVARAALRSIASPSTPVLDSSLAAFELDLAGDRRHAREMLVALERNRYRVSNQHPYLTGIDRLAASRWLLAAGDTTEAVRILNWHEAVVFTAPQAVHANAMLAGPAYLERARTLDALGQREAARASYEQFLRRYDEPVPAHRHLVRDARAALARLTTRDR